MNPTETIEVTVTHRFRNDPLWTLEDAKRRVRDVGGHYFDPDTLRFFASRFGATRSLPDGSLLFVESTEWRGRVARSWKVKQVTRMGKIETPTGDAVGLTSSGAARRQIERLYALAWHGHALGKMLEAGAK
jgi:hypothetical protein